MGTSDKSGGQRNNLSGESGRKTRSETSTPHKGSRVEPSHLTEQKRDERQKKTADGASGTSTNEKKSDKSE